MESEKLRLTLKQMRSRHILGKGLNWKNCEEDSEDEEDVEVEDEIDRAADHDMPPPSSTDSSLDLILSRLDAIARVQDKLVRNQNFLATYVSEHNKWEERTLLAITTHLDISSSVDLPPRSPFLPRSPTPPSPPLFPTAKGKEKMGEPSMLAKESVEASLKKVMDSVNKIPRGENVQKSGEEGSIDMDDEDSAGEQFIIAPHGAHGVAPEGELGATIDEIDRAGDMRVDDPSTAATTPDEDGSTPDEVDLEDDSA